MRFKQNWQAARYDFENKKEYQRFDAEVPGNVQYDYARAFDFKDIQFSDNVEQFDEIEDYYWIYSTYLEYRKNKGESVWFVAEGIDYAYDILLDGKTLYSDEGMFTPIELDITNVVNEKSLLQVVIYPHPKRKNAPLGRSQADQSCKPPFCYGWDWNPRLLISGLWRNAYVETRNKDYIRACEPYYTLNDGLDSAVVSFITDCDSTVNYTFSDADDNILYQGEKSEFELKDIRLWWCNGQGTPYLYKWKAETATHTVSGTVGFRKIRLVHNVGADKIDGFSKSRYPVPITIELNNRKILALGSNWVNPELFVGRIDEKRYSTLLTLAKDAGMNILRSWGGSGINKPEFYDICDRLGIMVWQEFMLSCNNYIGTKSYLRVLEKEARSIVRALRPHPCIVMWCGGNELFNNWSGMDDQSSALRLLNKICYEEDFEKPFLMTSPLSGMAHGGYSFEDLFDGRDVFQIFKSSHNTAYTEFGVPAMSPVAELKKIIPEEELFPIKKTKAWITHHAFEAWVGNSWIFPEIISKYFGEAESIEKMVEYSQKLQYIGYKAIFEEARRQWPYCSMAINWCFSEPWITAANNSIIAYPDIKKSGYFAVKEAIRPVMASARIPKFTWKSGDIFSAEIWFLNNSEKQETETIEVYIEMNGKRYTQLEWNTQEVSPRTNKIGPTTNFVLPDVLNCIEFKLVLKTSNTKSDNEYSLLLSPKKHENKKVLNL